MNIAMEQTEEYQNGQLKAKYGDAFIRGNNGTQFFICTAPHVPTSALYSVAALLLTFCIFCTVLYISSQSSRSS